MSTRINRGLARNQLIEFQPILIEIQPILIEIRRARSGISRGLMRVLPAKSAEISDVLGRFPNTISYMKLQILFQFPEGINNVFLQLL